MENKILIPVKVSERLPINSGIYFCDYIDSKDSKTIREYSPEYSNWWKSNIEFWYEEIEVEEGESKKILPNDDRIVEDAYTEEIIDYCGIINNYHKSLEAAENEILELKAKIKIQND